MVDLIIRRAREKDIEQLYDIENLSFKSPWSKQSFENEINKNKIAYYIAAEVNNKIVGYAGSWVAFDEMHITTLAVHPDWRYKKIGKMLLLSLFKKAINKDVKVAILEVRVGNMIAQDIYNDFGFNTIGKRGKYYQDGEDALVMACQNIHSDTFLNKIKEEDAKLNSFFNSVSFDVLL